MKKNILQNALLLLLSIVFSVGLMFAFIELPGIIDQLIQERIHTPHFDQAYKPMQTDVFLSAFAIQWIGYICLGLILVFIVLGLVTKKTAWTWMSAILLFLPVFGTFAVSMFYLAGLGLFNVIVFPFMDASVNLLNLGDVVLVPYWVLIWLFDLISLDLRSFLIYFFMFMGAFLFITGVFVWFRTRYRGQKVARHWIYKYSRHPQYLGWIIWSYGLMLFGPTLNNMKRSWSVSGSLPWLLGAMVIIAICLLEEVKMKERAGGEYEKYRNRTPFLFPLPKWLKHFFNYPFRALFKKERPSKKREIAFILVFYTLIFIGLSAFWVDWSPNKAKESEQATNLTEHVADSLVYEILKPQNRRYRQAPVQELAAYGEPAHPYLVKLLESDDPVVKEFVMGSIREQNIRTADDKIIAALLDSTGRVRREALACISEFKMLEAKDTLLYFYHHPEFEMNKTEIMGALSSLGCYEVKPGILEMIRDERWYIRRMGYHYLDQMDFERNKQDIYAGLKDENRNVRADVIGILLQRKPKDALPWLEDVLDDEDWEVRFYAKQAIKMIRKE